MEFRIDLCKVSLGSKFLVFANHPLNLFHIFYTFIILSLLHRSQLSFENTPSNPLRFVDLTWIHLRLG